MPLSSGLSIHDDTKHKGSAKRDTLGGVAALNVSGDILALGSDLELTRDGTEYIKIIERTSGESVILIQRQGVNDYTMRFLNGAAHHYVQLANMKGVANGIAGLDASVEIPVALLKTDVANGIAGLDASALLPEALIPGIEKVYELSNDILHSHDADAFTVSIPYVRLKDTTISTLVQLGTTIRIGFGLWSVGAAHTAYGKIYRNGAPVGTERSVVGTTPTYFYEDLTFSQGDVIGLWVHSDNEFINAYVNEFRVFGLESDLTLAEAIVNTNVGLIDPFGASNTW